VAEAEGQAGGDPVPDPHPQRAAAQVGQGGVDAAAQVDHQVVAENAAGAEQLADRPSTTR
jgi:hypothetical protein